MAWGVLDYPGRMDLGWEPIQGLIFGWEFSRKFFFLFFFTQCQGSRWVVWLAIAWSWEWEQTYFYFHSFSEIWGYSSLHRALFYTGVSPSFGGLLSTQLSRRPWKKIKAQAPLDSANALILKFISFLFFFFKNWDSEHWTWDVSS